MGRSHNRYKDRAAASAQPVDQCLERGFIKMAEIGYCLEGFLPENQGCGTISRKASMTTLLLIDWIEWMTMLPCGELADRRTAGC